MDFGTKRVQLDGALVESLIAKAPPRFTQRARNRERDVTVGEENLIFIATGGPAFASDLDRGQHAGNYADMCNYIRVVQSLNIIHQDGGPCIEPTDLPPETRHLDIYLAATPADKTWKCWGWAATGSRRRRHDRPRLSSRRPNSSRPSRR